MVEASVLFRRDTKETKSLDSNGKVITLRNKKNIKRVFFLKLIYYGDRISQK